MAGDSILVIGGDGVIGAALVAHFKQENKSVFSTTRRGDSVGRERLYLDLTRPIDIAAFPSSIGAAVFCAGITRLEDCRQDPAGTARINVEAVCNLAAVLAARGVHLLYLSTNQVFDGSSRFPLPQDPVSPVTEYGRQKAEVEARLRASCAGRLAVLRLTKVIGDSEPLFERWAHEWKNGSVVKPFSDMFMAPVSSMLAVSVIGRMLEKWSPGIYHLSADRDISYAEAAYAGADIMGVNPLQVQPISVSDIGIDQGSFPARTALNMDGLSSKFGVGPINARHTVEQYFINRTCRG